MGKYVHIRSASFPILPGETDELVNEGMYGKALAQYLQHRLAERGYQTPLVCCEDWGWWVEVVGPPFAFGVCIYCDPRHHPPTEFVCTDSVLRPRVWNWKSLRFVETAPWVARLQRDLVAIFESDPAVEIVQITDEFPLG